MKRLTRALILVAWITLIVILPLLGIAGYVAFSRWPVGAGAGDGTNLTATTQPVERAVIRVASYNIHSGIGADGNHDLDRIAVDLKDFDLAGLQETRGQLFGPSQVFWLAQKTKLNGLFAPTEHTRFHDNFGNALLTRLPIESWQRIPLPGTQSSGHRNVLLLRTRINKMPVTVLVTHVDRVIDRKAQIDFLFQLFMSLQPPVVIMGDFNTRRDDPLLQPFLTHSRDATASNQADRIDWIFTRGFDVIASGAIDHAASDHPLVWAKLTPARSE